MGKKQIPFTFCWGCMSIHLICQSEEATGSLKLLQSTSTHIPVTPTRSFLGPFPFAVVFGELMHCDEPASANAIPFNE